MSDVLVPDVPDDVLAGLDARAAQLGLSRVEYIRRRLAQHARVSRAPVTHDDLQRMGRAAAGLADDNLIAKHGALARLTPSLRARRDVAHS